MDIAWHYTLLTLLTLFSLKQQHVCLYILLGKVRTLLEWADELLSKMLGDVLVSYPTR